MLDTILDLLREHWDSALFWVGGLALGALWGRARARRRWERREFLHRLNVSLNTVDDGTLRIRTVLEKDLNDVLLNREASRRVTDAAGRTTEANPLIPLAKEDAWFVLNAILNEISERFAVGLLRRDLGEQVRRGTYVLCLTNEVAGAVRTHKIRAMMIRRDVLEHLPTAAPLFERPNHETRWSTLQCMAEAQRSASHLVLTVEIAA